MEPLNVPVPQLVFDPPAGPPELEKPVTVRLDAPTYPDSLPVPAQDVRTVGVFVYRNAMGSEELWNEKDKAWVAAPTDLADLAALQPVPLTAADGEPVPWKGLLVAVGQKDGDGHARFAKAQGGQPVYRLRAFVHAVRNGTGYQGLSVPSADLLFVSGAEKKRFAVVFDTEQSEDAGLARLMFRNASLQPAGFLEIRASGGQEIEIANCTTSGAVLARVTLSASGDVHIAPASGRQIVLDGDLEAGLITYQPQGGGARQTL